MIQRKTSQEVQLLSKPQGEVKTRQGPAVCVKRSLQRRGGGVGGGWGGGGGGGVGVGGGRGKKKEPRGYVGVFWGRAMRVPIEVTSKKEEGKKESGEHSTL